MRQRAVRMVLEHGGDRAPQWAAIGSVAAKIACTAETLRKCVWQAERGQRQRLGGTSEERDGIKTVAWRELPEEHFIFVSRRSATYEAVADAVRQAGVLPRHFLGTQTAETAACLAAEGLGITVLQVHNLAEMAHYGFVELPVRELDCGLGIALIALDRPLSEASASSGTSWSSGPGWSDPNPASDSQL